MKNGKNQTRRLIPAAAALILSIVASAALSACSSVRTVEPKKRGVADPGFRVVQLYFLSEKREIQPGVAKAAPVRWIRTGKRFHTRVVRTLLAGPIPAEREKGYYSNFFPPTAESPPWPMMPASQKPLKAYFNSVQVSDGVATVDFDSPALTYLNAPAALQFSIKEPIRRTLTNFKEIHTVRFSINGEVFTQWKA